jgi:hypothetical protein
MANPEHLKILKQTVEVPHAFRLPRYGVLGCLDLHMVV